MQLAWPLIFLNNKIIKIETSKQNNHLKNTLGIWWDKKRENFEMYQICLFSVSGTVAMVMYILYKNWHSVTVNTTEGTFSDRTYFLGSGVTLGLQNKN